MSVDIIQFASIAGELSKNLWGRTDFEKYDAAWARAHNWMVDYRGGLMTRPGFEFGDFLRWSEGEKIKFVEFQFAPDIANTYLCVFYNNRVRFIQDNAYVLESPVSISGVSTAGGELQFTSTAHGYVEGNWIKLTGFTEPTLLFLNGRTVYVTAPTNNTFKVQDLITGDTLAKSGTLTGTGSAARVYTISSPYTHEELDRLQAVQIRDYIRLTHPDHPIRNLIRHGATDWEIAFENIGHSMRRAGRPSVTYKSHSENAAFVYQVTAVDVNGEEGLPNLVMEADGPDLMGTNKRSMTISWPAIAGAIYYNVYRSRQVRNNFFSDMTVGYIGQATGRDFPDPGITPDFTRQPPITDNPFANNRILYVTVENGGGGFNYRSTINWPGGGSGAEGFLIVDEGGRTEGIGGTSIRGVKILDGGRNYTGTTVTASPGTGASMVATLSAASGNFPHCCGLFQQRMVYGATDQHPLRLFGSRPGFFSNFDVSDLSSDDDAYGFDLDSERISPLRHIFPVRGGLLVFNEVGVWLVGGRNNNTLTANNANADLQNATGGSYVRPVYIDSFVVYISAGGQEIRLLAYDDVGKVFADNNLALLSNHLFSPVNQVTSLSYAPVPYKMLYATQANGRMLSLTVDSANSIYACTPLWTKGDFHTSQVVLENNESRLYVATQRNFNGNRVMFFERQDTRRFNQLEDACCSDACLRLPVTTPSDSLTPSSLTGEVTFTR